MEQVGDLETERHVRVGIDAAQNQYQTMQEDARIKQRRQRKTPVGGDHEYERNGGGKDLQRPGQPVIRCDAGRYEDAEQ